MSDIDSWTIPTLQQICYEVLAEFSGYLCEVDPISDEGMVSICARSNAFGLANVEDLLTQGSIDRYIDTIEFWKRMYFDKLNQEPKYLVPERELIKGEDYYRQAYLASYLKNEFENRTLDDEDLERLINMCSGNLKLLVIGKNQGFDLGFLLSSFPKVLHVSLENSKIGAASSFLIKEFIEKNRFLQTLNLKSCDLGDAGALQVAEALAVTSSLRKLEMPFNDITLIGVRVVFQAALVNNSLGILDLSRNVYGREVKPASNLVKELKQQRNIIIKIV